MLMEFQNKIKYLLVDGLKCCQRAFDCEKGESFVRGIRGLEGKALTVVHDSEPVVKRTYARAWFKRRGEAAASELRSTD